jgi:glycosyltransferase 2 family protein
MSDDIAGEARAFLRFPRMDPRLLRVLKIGFTVAAMAAIGYAIVRSRTLLETLWPTLDGTNLAAAVAVWIGLHFLSPVLSIILLSEARPLTYKQAFVIHASRLPARYLPGGIWHTVGRLIDLRDLGYSGSVLARFVLVENAVAAAFTLGVGSAFIFALGNSTWTRLAGLLSAACLVGYCLIPLAVRKVIRSAPAISTAEFARITLVVVVFWALASTAFVLFVKAFGGDVLHESVARIVGTYLFAWGAGFVAIFAPQGVGVFEYVAGALLGGAQVLGAASIMVAFRLVVLAADVCTWLISAGWRTRPS